MKKILSLFILFFALNLFSQKEANYWYFGRNAGVDFNTNPPTALTNGLINTDEGSSSFSDSNGNLLFYSDGITVYNKNHEIMNYSDGSPGNNLKGNPTSTQSGMIIPKPGSTTIYYLFTVGTDYTGGLFNENPGFNYYTIDVSKNNNLGEIIDGPVNLAIDHRTNIDLSKGWSEKVAAVKGKDCNTYWVVSFIGSTFYSYKIDSSGVKVSDVKVSSVSFTANDKRGYLQVSPDGKKIVLADYNAIGGNINGSLTLFDFNNETGVISASPEYLISNFSNESPYGVAFSRDSKKLYTSTYNGQFNIYQFDLTSTNIPKSKKTIISKFGFRGALQLGPNGKIYVSIPDKSYLDAIENPSEEAEKVIYTENAIYLDGRLTGQGLPPFISSLLLPVEIKNPITNNIMNDENLDLCVGNDITFIPEKITGKNITYEWNFNNGTTINTVAFTEELALKDLKKSNSGEYTLTIKLTDDCGNITQYDGTFKIEIFEAAKAKANPETISFCDTDTNTPNEFNLSNLKDTEILDGLDPTIFNVVYFDDLPKATANVSGTELPTNYQVNTASKQTIYARVQNSKAPNNCFAITSFELEVTNFPEPVQPKNYILCDDINSPGGDTDGVTNNFRLSSKDVEILGALNPNQYFVSYHKTLLDAQTSSTSNVIDKNSDYQVTNSEYIYIRVENKSNPDCNSVSDDTPGSKFSTLQLIVAPLPVLKSNPELDQCISDSDTNPTVNLTIAEINITSTPNVTFEYFEDQTGLNKISNETAYPVLVNTIQSVFVKVTTVLGGCSRDLIELKINVGKTPNNPYNQIQPAVCDDYLDAQGNDTINNSDIDNISHFTLDKNSIINSINPPPNTNVFFYENSEDRANSLNEIDITDYRNDINKIDITKINGGIQFPIYYKILSTINNNCQGLGEFYLQIRNVPLSNKPTDFELCDDATSGNSADGINSGINLRDKVNDILGTTQTETDYIVSFHTTASGANTNADIITNDTNFTNTPPAGFTPGDISEQTIFVRVQDRNGDPKCFNDHVSFKVIVYPNPVVSTTIAPLAICDADADPRNRTTNNIDLTSKNGEILNGRTNHRVAYYATQLDALNNNEIPNATNFENSQSLTTFPTNFNTDDPGIQTIFFKVFDLGGNMCESVFATFQLVIYPEPNIPLNISDYSDCDNNSDSFADDTNGIVANISLKNKIPEILANYQPSEFADFSVTFYNSKPDADAGNIAAAINENQFENTTNNQTIYVRVENTKNTAITCVHTDLSFKINIKPLPNFTVMGEENIDTPQIICLNDLPLTIEAENPSATYNYVWTDENNTVLGNLSSLDVTTEGKYTVTASDQSPVGCSRKRTIVVQKSNIATLKNSFITIIDESNNIGSSDNISISIDTNSNDLGPGDYQFAVRNDDNGDRFPSIGFQDEPLFENLEGGIYTIIVNDKNGCSPDTTLQISVIQFPKFFTPNGDGKNDTWVIKGANKTFYPNSSINIFNRFGKLVAQIPIDSQGWNGSYSGKKLPSDDYWFNIQLIPADTSKQPILKKGHFSLLRR